MVVFLLQENDEGHEKPTAFFNKVLQGDEIKYNILEKSAYALVKALEAFRIYVLQSCVTSYFPTTTLKHIFVQEDSEGK